MLCGSASLSQSMETPPPPRPPSMPSPAPNATRGWRGAAARRRWRSSPRSAGCSSSGSAAAASSYLRTSTGSLRCAAASRPKRKCCRREAAASARGKTACPCPPNTRRRSPHGSRSMDCLATCAGRRRPRRASSLGAPRSRRTMPPTRGCSRGCEIQSRALPRRASRCRWRPAVRCRRRRSTRRSAVRWCTMRRSVPFTRCKRSSSCEGRRCCA